MRSWKRWAGSGLAVVVLAAGFSTVTAVSEAGAATSKTCPLAALTKATKPVEINFWHSMNRANGDALQKLTDAFNSSQGDVKVNLVNQIDYVQTFTKYKAGLASGDLPDIVQLQETEQQQIIDTQTVLPASVCAKADKYSFSDFLPRIISYFTVQGTQYAMPFNNSGPVLFYNKKAFTAAGLDAAKPPTTLAEMRTAAEKLKANGVEAPLGLKTEPGYFEHWRAMADKLYVNNSNGRKGRATKTVFNDATGREVFTWLSGMVKDGLATTNADLGTGSFDNLLGIRSGSHAMAIDTSAALGTISSVLSAGNDPNIELGVAPMPGPSHKGGVLVSGGALYMVNKSKAEKQAAAWKYLKFLDEPANITAWAIGTGYIPIRKSSAASAEMTTYWAQNPTYKVAYDQLLNGPTNPATSGSVIGQYTGVRDAVRDAENSMFLQGKDPATALQDASNTATTAIQDYNSKLGL
ncbi:MAG: sn-glycerol 3-phosphate transport system substrate-binding protein [Actinomycetota bacterium]|nr:sn-glycerol 3-phosphate transport system substrate-binding protein [Actinomycetota bacterium]